MTTTKVNLANTVEGILPVANGGTGSSTGVSPGGSTTQVQFNNAGAFGGDSGFVYTGGNVGIGTSSPAQKLDVQAAAGSQARFKTATGTDASYITVSNNAAMYIGLDNSAGSAITGTAYAGFMYSSANAPLIFINNATEKMRIDSSGNVVIGVNSASGKFRVYEGNSSDCTINFEAAVANYAVNLALWGNNATGSRYNNITSKYGATEQWYIGGNGSDATLAFKTGGSERLRIGSAGQLGLSGANYGSSGQVLTSNGSGSAPSWQPVTLPAGTVLQVQQFETTATGTFGNSPAQLPGPFQVTITPSSASNKILIMCQINIGFGNGDCRYPGLFLRRNGSNINVGNKGGNNGTNVTVAATQQTLNVGSNSVCNITYLDSPGTTSAVTYSVWGQADFIGGDRTNYLNRPLNLGDAMRLWTASNIIAMEIKG